MARIYGFLVLISLFLNIQYVMACGCTPPPVIGDYCGCRETPDYLSSNYCHNYRLCGGITLDANNNPVGCNTTNLIPVSYCRYDFAEIVDEPAKPFVDKNTKICGSIVKVQNQSVQENIPLLGSNLDLVYSSERVFGRKDKSKYRQKISQPLYTSIEESILVHTIDGVDHQYTYPQDADYYYDFEWNGLNSAGQEVIDGIETTIKVDYRNDVNEIFRIYITHPNFGFYNVKLLGLGGFTLTNHHFYNLKLNKLHMGSGDDRTLQAMKINLSGDLIEKLDYESTIFTNYLVASEDGTEAYIFDLQGYHLHTRSTRTSKVLTTFSYDINKKLTSIVDAFGNVISITRPNSTTVQILTPSGKTTTLNVNADGFAETITTPNAEVYEMTYLSGVGQTGLMQTFETPKGLISTFGYDSEGVLVTDTNNAGQSLGFSGSSINAYIYLTEAMSAEGRITQYYNDYRKEAPPNYTPYTALQIVSPSGATSFESSYDFETTRTNPDYSNKIINREEDPRFNNHVRNDISIFIGSNEQPHSISQSNDFTYLDTDLLKLNDHTKTVTYESNSWVTTYDQATQTYTLTSPLNRTQKVKYNNFDQIIETKNASFLPVVSGYDTLGRLSTMSQGTRSWTYVYNSEFEVQSITNPLNETTSYVYDNNSRVTEIQHPNTQKTFLSYDEMGNLSGIKANGKPWHNFLYTLFGEILKYLIPDIGSGVKQVQYQYNNDKQLTRITRENLSQINLNYNNQTGLLEEIETPEGDYTYGTDLMTEQLSRIWSPTNVKVEYEYLSDVLSLQRTKDQSVLDQNESKIEFEYDKMLVSKVTVKHSDVNSNKTSNTLLTYNADRLLTKVGDLTLTRQNTTGLITKAQLTGGVNENFTYDTSFGELSQYDYKVSSTQKYKEIIVRDALSRVTQIRQTTVPNPEIKYNYAYDTRGRLSNAKVNDVVQRKYTYDSNSNRTQVQDASNNVLATGTYNDQDQLLTYVIKNSGGTVLYNYTYIYDDFGNRLTKTDTTNNIKKEYVYNSRGSMVSYTRKNATTLAVLKTITYNNDGLGRRITKTEDGVLQTRYIYDEDIRLVGQVSPDGEVLTQYVYADKSHVPAYMIRNTVKYKIVSNLQGSVRFVVLATTGAVVQELNYDEYGNVITNTNPDFQPFGFAGGIYDTDTKLTRYGARDYDAEVGRWTAKDPIKFQGGDVNLYGYVLNDPVNFVDPLGLWKWPTSIVNDSGIDAAEKYPDDPHGKQDSYRHCLASCMMTMENGAFSTWFLGGAHEVRGSLSGQSKCEGARDTGNNQFGSYLGTNTKSTIDCQSKCQSALNNGLLQ